MINMTVMGGLGNQLFQWACARNLQEKYGHYINYNYDFYKGQDWRKPQLDEFKNIVFNSVEENYTLGEVGVGDSFNYKNFLTYDLSQKQRCYHLQGYWQSEKYFQENQNVIRNNLDIDEDTRYYISNKYPFIDNEQVASIHIRRTDYVSSNGYHPVQPMSYYEQALGHIDCERIVVFSDDIGWCKENLQFNNMIFSEDNTDIQDLYLMSMCQHNVIANSSFSWWAAWLNKNTDKRVVAPSKWFGPGAPSSQDIIPEDWITI
jgi:hypothetical protein|tara:strand:+ start:1930 stop:2712 length:783 start_codon:yes stop_codon:yes gene_type:complete